VYCPAPQAVIDTFGQTSFLNNAGADNSSDHTVGVLQNFSRYAAEGGASTTANCTIIAQISNFLLLFSGAILHIGPAQSDLQ
jgi:hypothetical protein